jgi:hypothetical protein
MESLPPVTKIAPLSLLGPFPCMGKKRRLLTLPKCFSRVARSLETIGREERNERGIVRGRDGAEGEREEERSCGRDGGMKS